MTDAGIKLWAIIFAVGAANFLVRLSFIELLANKRMPPLLIRSLRYVAIAMLTALVVPMVLATPGAPAIMTLWPNAKPFAALIALVVAFFTRSMGWTLATGMGALWLLQAATT